MKMPFGEYQGRDVVELPDAYLEWIVYDPCLYPYPTLQGYIVMILETRPTDRYESPENYEWHGGQIPLARRLGL